MLLLKRFEFSYHQMSFVKNSCVVIVPRMLTIPENQTYEIYAFVEHFGSLRGGHYTATIKSQDEDRWYEFNDSTVTPLHKQMFQNHTTEKSNTAYLLFYRKKSLGSVENRDVSDDEVLPPDTNKNYHQPQAKRMKTRDKNIEIQNSSKAREERSADEEASNKGAQSKWTGLYGDQDDSRERKGVRGSHDAEARQKPKYEEGVGGEAEGEYAEMTEDELRAREKRKIPAKKDKEGKNGQKEKQHAGRIEGKKENTEAEGLASTNVRELERHDSRKDTEGKKSVSSGEQNMQKNPLACKEETGSSKEVKMRTLREENKPKMQVNNQSQRAKTSEMRDHVDEDREGRVDDALITKENRAKNQVIKNHDEITEEPLPLQKGPEL
ncbi:uncharacterized protein LOC133420484 [Cololabis saira]|uniref:uncharacterized protein LOC133420484 n=1 Tax=Cololabis saira TaxID=129043 RepID=UPI002AD42376|nr:uncharacterized protein LOC133420484 [Cololabis saira]